MDRARTIFCIDLDAFFVSVERLRRPELRGRPVIVGGAPGPGARGVVCSASYEARRYGVRSAMPIAEAEKRLRGVEGVAWLPVSMEDYGRHSAGVRAAIDAELPLVEAASIDEFYADATGYAPGEGPRAAALGERVAARIERECGLPCSIGIATSKLVAKIATDEAKPRGILRVREGGEAAFLAALPVERIPGIGMKTLPRLHALGLRQIGDAPRLGEAEIATVLGAGMARFLIDAAAGVDPSRVVERTEARSIGHEETFERDLVRPAEIDAAATDLAERVASRLRTEGLQARTIHVKWRYAARRARYVPGMATRDVYETVSRARTAEPTDDGLEIADRARALIREGLRAGEPIRLLGVSVGGFAPRERQRTLFDVEGAATPADARRGRLNRTLDEIRARWGFESVVRASTRPPEHE